MGTKEFFKEPDPLKLLQGQPIDAEGAAGTTENAEHGVAISPPDHKIFDVVDGEERCAGTGISTRRAVLRALRDAPRAPRRSVVLLQFSAPPRTSA